MPFTDTDGNPITCHTCPFRVDGDCTALPMMRVVNHFNARLVLPAGAPPLRPASRPGRHQVAGGGDGGVAIRRMRHYCELHAQAMPLQRHQ